MSMGRATEQPVAATPIETLRFVAGTAAKRFFSNASSALFYTGLAAIFVVRLSGGQVPLECYGILLVLATITGIQMLSDMVREEEKKEKK